MMQYIALQTSVQPEEVEIYLVKELNFSSGASMIDLSEDKLQILEETDTLAGFQTHNFMQGNLVSF